MGNVAAGANPISLKRGIDKATSFLVDKIAEHSKPIEDSKAIAQVGTISAGNDEEVGQMGADAMDKVGKEGVISLEEGKSMETELEVTEGMRFDKGYISPYFRHRHRADGSGARRALHLAHRQEDRPGAGPGACSGADRPHR